MRQVTAPHSARFFINRAVKCLALGAIPRRWGRHRFLNGPLPAAGAESPVGLIKDANPWPSPLQTQTS